MALTVLFNIARSADFKSITISDLGTPWGVGGEMGTGDVTAITFKVYGALNVLLNTITFSGSQRTAFLAGSGVTIAFADFPQVTGWSSPVYAPDNFYVGELVVVATAVTAASSLVPFDSYFYIKKIVMDSIKSVQTPINTFYEANKKITGDVVSLLQLNDLSANLSIAEENKWRKVYNFLVWNYNVA